MSESVLVLTGSLINRPQKKYCRFVSVTLGDGAILRNHKIMGTLKEYSGSHVQPLVRERERDKYETYGWKEEGWIENDRNQ